MRWQSGSLAAWSLPSSLDSILFLPHVRTGILFLLIVITYAEFTENMSNSVGAKAFPSFARNKIWISMIYIELGLLTCPLQVYPSQMQMLFSMRKGNLSKRSFPYKILGYGDSIAISSAVCQKPDQLSHMVDFLDINNLNDTYKSWHYPSFLLCPPRHATYQSWDGWGVRNSLISVHKISVSTERPGGPCCCYSILFQLGKLPWWSLRLRNC